MDCEVPFIRADWFIANASLAPLYYEILELPETETEIAEKVGVDVLKNLKNAPGLRVLRAGFNESGVSANIVLLNATNHSMARIGRPTTLRGM